MKILGIESTCDETGVGVVEDGKAVLLNLVSSSVNLYKQYGGVVPEIAAREQLQAIIPLLDAAEDIVDFNLLDGFAVSYGPGLVGSLLIGVETAKILSIVYNKSLYAVNHLLGHVFANWLKPQRTPDFPLISLVVSGGHTDLLFMKSATDYKWLGGTRDDAAGEAFDKVGKLLGLGYPGGPEVERISKEYDASLRFKLPRPMIQEPNFDFSFSGLKTAVVNVVGEVRNNRSRICAIAHEFQHAVVDVLVSKTLTAAKTFGVRSIVVSGGVSANSMLRGKMIDEGEKNNFIVHFPDKKLSTDNGAMIACAAFYNRMKVDPLKLYANPSLHF